MNILPQEPMSYKHQIKNDELITKLRVIRNVKLAKRTNIEVAKQFHCHRNTISNILNSFSHKISKHNQALLLQITH